MFHHHLERLSKVTGSVSRWKKHLDPGETLLTDCGLVAGETLLTSTTGSTAHSAAPPPPLWTPSLRGTKQDPDTHLRFPARALILDLEPARQREIATHRARREIQVVFDLVSPPV